MYEYRLIRWLPTRSAEPEGIAELGAEGWELICAATLQDGVPAILLFFRRRNNS